jgi:hypothetical protein
MKVISAGGAPAGLRFADSTALCETSHASVEIKFEHLRKGQ